MVVVIVCLPANGDKPENEEQSSVSELKGCVECVDFHEDCKRSWGIRRQRATKDHGKTNGPNLGVLNKQF